MNDVLYVQRGLMPIAMGGHLLPLAVEIDSALDLLDGEAQGFSIDATHYDDFTGYAYPAYVGGPTGGTVAVIDTGTPANNLSDVPLNKSNLTQSGTSPKMVHFPTAPYVRWTPHNYIEYSQALAGVLSSWSEGNITFTNNTGDTVAPDGTSTATKVVTSVDGSPQAHLSFQDVSPPSFATAEYTISAYVKAGTATWFAFSNASFFAYFNIGGAVTGTVGNGTTSITSVGNGWYRCVWTSETSHDALRLRVVNADNTASYQANGEYLYVWGVQSNRGHYVLPYVVNSTATTPAVGIPQAYDAVTAKYGILTEPAATNVSRASEDLTTFWTNRVTTETANTDVAPDGSTTADTITATAGTNVHTIYNQAIISSSVVRTVSMYVKAGTNSYPCLAFNDFTSTNNFFAAVFDISNSLATTATQTAVGGSSGTIVSTRQEVIGGGWFRISVTGSISVSVNPNTLIVMTNAATGNTFSTEAEISWNAAGTETLKIWGFQCETGSVATSYVPVNPSASNATRAKDIVKLEVSTVPYSQTVGTVVVRMTRYDIDTTNPFSWTLYQNNSNRILIYSDSGADKNGFFVNNGGSTQAFVETAETFSAGVEMEAAAAWAANDFAVVANGGTPVADPSGSIPNAITTFALGMDESANGQVSQSIWEVIYLPRRATNGELQGFTA